MLYGRVRGCVYSRPKDNLISDMITMIKHKFICKVCKPNICKVTSYDSDCVSPLICLYSIHINRAEWKLRKVKGKV